MAEFGQEVFRGTQKAQKIEALSHEAPDNLKTEVFTFNKSVEAHRESFKKYFKLEDRHAEAIRSHKRARKIIGKT